METIVLKKWEEVEKLPYKDLRSYAKSLGLTFTATPKAEEILEKLKNSKHYVTTEKAKQFFVKQDQYKREMTTAQKEIFESETLSYKDKVLKLAELNFPQYKIAVLFEVKWSEINTIVKG